MVSDHAYDCVRALQETFLEAKLHLFEAESAWDAEDDNMRRWMSESSGNPARFPEPRSPEDETHTYLASMHLAGFARALADGLDCLAGAIVAIVPLGLPIFTSSWGQVRPEIHQRASGKRARPQRVVSRKIDATVIASGPEGWSDWLAAWRNMLVHRPHQLALAHVDTGSRSLIVPAMTTSERMRVVNHLPRMPDRSTVEAIRDAGSPSDCYLEEDARVTTEKLFVSALRATDEICGTLLDHWRDRRSGRIMLDQPLNQQWPMRDYNEPFIGFAPRSSKIVGAQAANHPDQSLRWSAAQLTDPARHAFWGNSEKAAERP